MEQKKPRGTHRGVQRGEKAQQSTPCRHVCVRTHPRAKDLLQLPWYSLAGWSLSVLQGDCRGRKAKKWLKKNTVFRPRVSSYDKPWHGES